MFWPRLLLITCQTCLGNEHGLTALMRGSWDCVKVLCVLKVSTSASPTVFSMAIITTLLLNVIKQICLEKIMSLWEKISYRISIRKCNFLFSDHRKKWTFVSGNLAISHLSSCLPASDGAHGIQAFTEIVPTGRPSNRYLNFLLIC